MNIRIGVVGVLAAACATMLWAQGLIVCRACGREAKPGETACAHCKAELQKPKVEAVEKPAAPAIDKDAEVGRGAATVVEASVRQARELEKKEPEVALCYYQNALALMRLVPADTYPASVREAILGGNERAMQALLRGRIPCRKCSGSGKYQLDMGKVDRSKGVKAADGVACPACKGLGTFAGFREVSKVMSTILQGRGEFERRQMVAGDVKVGRAFVPPALEKLMSNRQRALVMTGMPGPCSECQLTGRQACTVCRSKGLVKCDYKGCTQGFLKDEKKTGARQEKRMNQESVNKCPKCEGSAEMPCLICKGVGSVACKKCDGSGLAPRCQRCTGTGLMACNKCKGTGAVKGAPCAECKGETMMLCTTCRGEGAQIR